MKRIYYFAILTAMLASLIGGCTRPETRVDRFFGTSYNLAKHSQINNPKAGIKDGPSVGFEGDVASKVINRYEKSFEGKPAKTEKYSIDIEGMNIE